MNEAGTQSRHSRWLRRYALHGALLAALVCECLAALAGHVSEAELRRRLESGTEAQRAAALYVLANRDIPPRLDDEDIRRFMRSDEVRVREIVMTTNLMRYGSEAVRRDYVAALGETEEAWRCRFLLDHRVGPTGKRLTRQELARFLAALAEDK
ncbi:MAG: hypothetical protein KKB50_17845 [Planctomycetes bacterium]|nr:hypothetical protein [Planctomycetota bacterium]